MNFDNCIENTIEFYKNDKQASVTFSQGRFITKIRKLSEKYPDKCRILSENKDGSILAHIPTNWVKIGPPKRVSEKNRKMASDRMKKYMSQNKRSHL